MSRYRVFAGNLISRDRSGPAVLEVAGGRVSALREPMPGEEPSDGDLDARAHTVLPGFLDTHVHGGFGLDMMDGSAETLREIARRLPSRGVTAFLATPLTSPWPAIAQAVRAAREVREKPGPGARVLGCHLEGPFINPEYKGAQNPEYIVPPNFDQLAGQLGDLIEEVRIVTLAPEMPGALPLIRELTARSIRASVGHTGATYDEVSAAIDAGATRATHCFNAMRGIHHREPGTAGAALARPELTAEIIWDNIHVHPAACRLLCAAKGPERVVAISDGTTGVGMPEGYEFRLWGLDAVVRNGAARLREGGALAGSAIALDDALRNATAEIGLAEATRLCSWNPAASLGLQADHGRLHPGAYADLVVLDDRLQVLSTYIGGERAYEAGA